MNRRDFIQSLAGATASVAAFPDRLLPAPDRRPRPNILWLVSEDNTFYYDGPYGDPCARTPHLDRLAAEGILYENAHSVAPVCAPSRCSIITGCDAGGLGTQHMRSARPLPPEVKFFPEYLRAAGYFCTNHVKTDYNTSSSYADAWDLCDETAHWRKRRPGQPFFAVFNFMESHESQLLYRQPLLTDPARVRVPAYLPDTPETRADLAQDYDCLRRVDEGVGRYLAQLEEDGLLDDTIVFYYADHGGVLPRSKRFLYDNGTHTPLIIRFPAKYRHLAPAAAGSRSRELVSYVDLAPTVLSLAGAPRPAYLQGRVLAGPERAPAPPVVCSMRGRMDERYDFSAAATDGHFRYLRNYLPHRPAGQHLAYLWHMASMQRFDQLYREGGLGPLPRAFFEPRAAEELFDCRADPDNVRNLAADPAFAAVRDRLRNASRAHLLRVRNTGFLPEAMMVEQAGGGSPAAVAADPARYPLERLLDLVDAAQLGAPPPAAIAGALRDPQPVVRYWGVICTFSLAAGPDLAPLLSDPDGSVRVAAAEAMLRRGADARAWDCLAEAVGADQQRELRLAALNALAYLPPAPAAVRPRLRAVITAAGPAPTGTPKEAGGEGGPLVTPLVQAENGWKRAFINNAARYLADRGLA